MTIKSVMNMGHENAVKRGAYADNVLLSVLEKLEEEIHEFKVACADEIQAIMVEFSEGMEKDGDFKSIFESHIKDSIEDELADIIIVALSAAKELNIDIEKHIELKMKYNQIR